MPEIFLHPLLPGLPHLVTQLRVDAELLHRVGDGRPVHRRHHKARLPQRIPLHPVDQLLAAPHVGGHTGPSGGEGLQHCQRLVTIPTNPEASSLNLAQSVLLLLYECAKAVRARQHEAAGEKAPAEGGSGRVISSADYERLLDNLKDMLLRLDCLHGDNPDYFLMPWRRLLARAQVRRHEYDALMGLCRQVRNKLDGGNKA